MDEPTCSIGDGEKVYARGWCHPHYLTWHRTGSPVIEPLPACPDLPGERWKPVVGYEGIYEVSDLGRVRSLPRYASDGIFHHGVLLKPLPTKLGYLQVGLCVNNKMKKPYVHVLVARAFIGPRPKGKEVAHEDGVPANCALSNLSYKTKSENALDMRRHGTHNHGSKTHCIHGHEFTPENTFVQRGNPLWRGCKQCRADRRREKREADRKAKAA